jgi:hypothetical protein
MSDRLTLANVFEDAGIERAKAERIASTIVDLIHDTVATKADVQLLRTDLTAFATKLDLAEAKAEILKWMVGSIGVQTVVIIGAVIALVRLVPH